MPLQNDGLRLLRHLSDLRFEEELRGYSKSQVDRVLQKLSPMAEEIEALQGRLSEAETRAASAEARLMERGDEPDAPAPPPPAAPVTEIPATPADFDETLRKTLVLAQRTADETVKEAYDEAERVTNNAHGEADLVLTKAKGEAEQIQTDAEARREELISGAEADRDRMLEEATTAAAERKTELEAALNEAEGAERAELVEQIANLQQIRSLLSTDIEKMERHLADRRTVIQGALAELSQVIEDPSSMDPAEAPELAEVEPVGAEELAPVGLSVEGLDDPLTASPSAEAEVAGAIDGEGEDPTVGSNRQEAEPDDAAEADDSVEAESNAASNAGPSTMFDDGGLSDAAPAPVGPETQEFAFVDVDDDRPDADVHEGEFADFPSDGGMAGNSVGGGESEGGTEAGMAGAVLTDAGVVSTSASDPWAVEASAPGDSAGSRPAWADAVPEDTVAEGPVTQDPFLEELRRATSDDRVDSDEALDRFLDGDTEDDRKSWFGRRSR